MSDPQSGAGPLLRSLGLTVYAPSLLFAIGQGAVIPIVALSARDAGASIAGAAVIVAVRGIGAMITNIPAGMLIARLGERRAMSVGTGVLILSLFGAVSSRTPVLFALFMFLMGCGWSVWLLARLAYVTDVSPLHLRGRALSTLGGVNRIGNFIGPFVGAIVISAVGTAGGFYVHMVSAVAGLIVLLVVPDPHVPEHPAHPTPVQFRRIVTEHAGVFTTAGTAALTISILRSARDAVIPLWADFVGVDAARVALIFGISSAMDMLMFYPAGSASDRFGRKWVAIPCMTIMATAFLLLPATSTFLTMILVGVLMGFGNGLGSGIIMTLGADFSPPRGRAEFLGVWRTVGDLGTAGGPIIASLVTAVVSLGAGSLTLGALGILGAAITLRVMPETLRPASLTDRAHKP